MIDASEAYIRASEVYDLITKEKFEEFKKEADEAIAKAISNGYLSCYILCDRRARWSAYQWLKTYGYHVDGDLMVLDDDSIYVSWRDAGSSPRGE